MFTKELTQLSDRRRLLAAEGDLHRGIICVEVASLRSQVTAARDRVRSLSPWLLAGGAVAGLGAAQKWDWITKWAPRALGAWRWWKKLKGRRGRNE